MDFGPVGATLLIIGILTFLGLIGILVAEGQRAFFSSFPLGFQALRSRWKIYLLDLVSFFSLVATNLGLIITLVALGAIVWYLWRGPVSQLGDYRLYLPPVWTVFWLLVFFLSYWVSEGLKKKEQGD